MTDDKLKPTKDDRLAAWPYRPSCYKGNETYTKWMNGLYDSCAPVIQAFARHRIAATDTQVSKHSELADRLERAMRPVSARQGGLFLQWKELDAILSALRQAPDAKVSGLPETHYSITWLSRPHLFKKPLREDGRSVGKDSRKTLGDVVKLLRREIDAGGELVEVKRVETFRIDVTDEALAALDGVGSKCGE